MSRGICLQIMYGRPCHAQRQFSMDVRSLDNATPGLNQLSLYRHPKLRIPFLPKTQMLLGELGQGLGLDFFAGIVFSCLCLIASRR
jgi:hypothetical protein